MGTGTGTGMDGGITAIAATTTVGGIITAIAATTMVGGIIIIGVDGHFCLYRDPAMGLLLEGIVS